MTCICITRLCMDVSYLVLLLKVKYGVHLYKDIMAYNCLIECICIPAIRAFKSFGRMGILAKRTYRGCSHSAIQASCRQAILVLQPFINTGNPAIWPFKASNQWRLTLPSWIGLNKVINLCILIT